MKKIFSICIALMLMFSCSVNVFAADDTLNPTITTTDSGSLNMSATVMPTYTVTIPESVILDETVTVKAANVLTGAEKAVKVQITGTDQTENAFAVTTTDYASITYQIKNGDSVMELNDALTFETDDSVTLSFDRVVTNQVYVGNYRGNVTFTISYENINN